MEVKPLAHTYAATNIQPQPPGSNAHIVRTTEKHTQSVGDAHLQAFPGLG